MYPSERFDNQLHTPESLAQTLVELPPNFVLVGSIGRCVLMGALKPLERKNGSVSDIDVIDETAQQIHGSIQTGSYRLDSLMTRSFRPHDDNSWGMFLPGQRDPVHTIDRAYCEPWTVEVPWGKGGETKVLPPQIQNELIAMFGPYRKNKDHMAKFRDFVDAQPVQLPVSVQQQFAEYRYLRQRTELYGSPEEPVHRIERTYRRVRRTFFDFAPRPVQRAVEFGIGHVVRKVRGTY